MNKNNEEDINEIDFMSIKNFFLKKKIFFILSATCSILIGIAISSTIKNQWIGTVELIFKQKRITKDEVKAKAEKNQNINESIFNRKINFEEAYTAYEIMKSNKFKKDLHSNLEATNFKKLNNPYSKFSEFKKDFKVSQIKQNIIRLTYRNEEKNLISLNLNNARNLYKEIYKNYYEKQTENLLNNYSQKIKDYESKIIFSIAKLKRHFSKTDYKVIKFQIMQNFIEKKGAIDNFEFINKFDQLSSDKQDEIFLELKKLKINNLILENLLYEYQVNLIKNNYEEPWILVNQQNIYKEDYRKKRLSYFLFSFTLINMISIFGLKIKNQFSK